MLFHFGDSEELVCSGKFGMLVDALYKIDGAKLINYGGYKSFIFDNDFKHLDSLIKKLESNNLTKLLCENAIASLIEGDREGNKRRLCGAMNDRLYLFANRKDPYSGIRVIIDMLYYIREVNRPGPK
ncbi:MAG: hypothetical protein PHH54_03510 [Candidatus Nanoarchaeia archaeon]|nr:hypothetical protein [Candidatus Nanoarchaeia archaeon]MDD5741025.1 hypothetical protein [Candidatus Nanoarchaeia archaeon]